MSEAGAASKPLIVIRLFHAKRIKDYLSKKYPVQAV